jgi:hypothetical protein
MKFVFSSVAWSTWLLIPFLDSGSLYEGPLDAVPPRTRENCGIEEGWKLVGERGSETRAKGAS